MEEITEMVAIPALVLGAIIAAALVGYEQVVQLLSGEIGIGQAIVFGLVKWLFVGFVLFLLIVIVLVGLVVLGYVLGAIYLCFSSKENAIASLIVLAAIALFVLCVVAVVSLWDVRVT